MKKSSRKWRRNRLITLSDQGNPRQPMPIQRSPNHKRVLNNQSEILIFFERPPIDPIRSIQNVEQTNQVNTRDLIAATSLVSLTQIGFKSTIVGTYDLEIWWMTSKKQWGTSSMLRQALCIISSPYAISNWTISYSCLVAAKIDEMLSLYNHSVKHLI